MRWGRNGDFPGRGDTVLKGMETDNKPENGGRRCWEFGSSGIWDEVEAGP